MNLLPGWPRDRSVVQPASSAWLIALQADQVLYQRLGNTQRDGLVDMANRFLATRRFTAVQGLEFTEAMGCRIALQACLPVLNLGLDHYDAVRSLVIYPSGFRVQRERFDEAGVLHVVDDDLAGEAWENGPVVLAWDEIEQPESGTAVVIHEFMHVLDALNGSVNGFPPIEDTSLAQRWPAVFAAAWDDHRARVDRGDYLVLDEYAADAPEEFFAVAGECFFADPEALRLGYPDVHAALSAYFLRQTFHA